MNCEEGRENMVLNIIMVEDEPVTMEETRKTIQSVAEKLQLLTVFRDFADGAEITQADILWADLFFLDIETKGENGIDTARRIREATERTPVVFTTNYESYSCEGYTVSAYRYLIKPVKAEKCEICLEHAASLAEMKSQEMFIIAQKGTQTLVYYRDIIYIVAEEHYCHVYMKKGDIKFRKRFNDMAAEVPEDQFIQSHRSYLVNRNQIHSWQKKYLIMQDGCHVPVSRPYRNAVSAAIAGNI